MFDDQYEYRPLNSASGDIRLVQIQSSQGNLGPIECSIKHFKPPAVPRYDCLSYTWGSPEHTQPIHLNGTLFHVTQNLHDALRQLESREKLSIWQNQWIWIDAMCINQSDNDEKSSQVQQMKSTFANAQQVIIWLGLQSGDSKHALWLLDHIAYLSQAYSSHKLTREQRLSKLWDELVSKEDMNGIEALKNLFSRPWWSRVWVLQEAMTAERSRIVCGPDSTRLGSSQTLFTLNIGWRQLPAEHRSPSWEALYPQLVSAVRLSKQVHTSTVIPEELPRPLLSVLDQVYVHSQMQATDPRDRLFALYGLGTNATELGLRVDYAKSCNRIYEEAARVLLKVYGLIVLSYCSGQRRHHSQLMLPSWVPNWEEYIMSPIHSFPSAGRKYNPDSKFFSASGSTSQPKTSTPRSDRTLALLGSKVSVIKEVGSSWPFKPLTIPDLQDSYKAECRWIDDVRRLAANQAYNSDSPFQASSVEDVSWRTGIADHIQKSTLGYTRVSKEDAAGYVAYRHLLSLSNKSVNLGTTSERYDSERNSWDYRKSMINCALQRRPIFGDDGRVGIGPDICQAGDVVCIFHGAKVPFVLRQVENGEYRLLGEAYVHGIMDGELMEGSPPTEIFVLC
jgi:hypothetical protein